MELFNFKILNYFIWIKARLVERSTWEGIIGSITIISSYIKPHYREIILSSGGSIWSLIRILTKDSKHGIGAAAKAAVEARDVVKNELNAPTFK